MYFVNSIQFTNTTQIYKEGETQEIIIFKTKYLILLASLTAVFELHNIYCVIITTYQHLLEHFCLLMYLHILMTCVSENHNLVPDEKTMWNTF